MAEDRDIVLDALDREELDLRTQQIQARNRQKRQEESGPQAALEIPPKAEPPVATAGIPDPGGFESLTPEQQQAAIERTKAAALDLGGGLLSSVPAVARGLVDAGTDLVFFANDVKKSLESHGVVGKISSSTLFPGLGFLEPEDDPVDFIARKLDGIVREKESTVTGQMIREVASFLTFFIPGLGPASRVPGLSKLASMGPKAKVTARILKDTIAGVGADLLTTNVIDEATQELYAEHSELRGPIEKFMDPNNDASAMEQRLRSAMLGAGFGVLSDVSITGLRALRANRIARREAERAVADVAANNPEEAQSLLDLLEPRLTEEDARLSPGVPREVRVDRKAEIGSERIAAGIAKIQQDFPDLDPDSLRRLSELSEQPYRVNMDRFETEDDVKTFVQEVTDLVADEIDQARRGRISQQDLERMVKRSGIGITELLSRESGAAPSPVEVLAFRKVFITLAEELKQRATDALASGASDVARYRYRKAIGIFHAVNAQFRGAAAEAGRSLRAFGFKVSGDIERAKAIGLLVDRMGGSKVTTRSARNMLRLLSDPRVTPGQIAAYAEKTRFAATMDAVREGFVTGLLFKPATFARNMFGNTAAFAFRVAERAAARGIAIAEGEQGVAAGEAMILAKKGLEAVRAMFSIGSQGLPDIRALVKGSLAEVGNRMDIEEGSINSLLLGIDPEGAFGRTVDIYGKITRLSGKALLGADNFYKGLSYWAELNAQAMRKATHEGVSKGWDSDRVALRMHELVNNPTEQLRVRASEFALENTFTNNAGKLAAALFQVRDVVPLAWLFMPFIRTPANLLSFGMVKRTPLALLSEGFQEAMARGGAERQLAMAQLAIGAGFMSIIFDQAYEGNIDGALPRRNKGLREAAQRSGVPGDTMRFGDISVSYRGLDPFASMMSATATFANLWKEYEFSPEDVPDIQEIFASLAVAVSSSVLDKAYFTGMSRIVEATMNPDRISEKLISDSIASMVPPLNSVFDMSARLSDTTLPETFGLFDAIIAKIPVLEARLTRRKDLWGRDIATSRWDQVSPVRIRKIDAEPIDREIIKNRIDQRGIQKHTPFAGAPDVDFAHFPRVYERYKELAGNDLKLQRPGVGKVGAMDYLNAVVTGNAGSVSRSFFDQSLGPDGGRAKFIRRIINQYREAAQAEIMRNPAEHSGDQFDDFRAYIEEKRRESIESRRPPGFDLDTEIRSEDAFRVP